MPTLKGGRLNEKQSKKSMKLLILLSISLALVYAECNVARIISCASTWYDGNADGVVTADEIKRFMINKPCGKPTHPFMGTTAIKLCDTNHDGVLSSVDAYDEHMSCLLTNESMLNTACAECDRCDAYVGNGKK